MKEDFECILIIFLWGVVHVLGLYLLLTDLRNNPPSQEKCAEICSNPFNIFTPGCDCSLVYCKLEEK